MKRNWVRIRRKAYGMDDIVLRDVTITPSDEIENIVTVTGHQEVQIETRPVSELPTQTVEKELPWWDPRRLFGMTTRKVEVPNTEGWELELYSLFGREHHYTRNEWQSRTYRISSAWLEMSTEE